MHLDFPQKAKIKAYKEYLTITEALVAKGKYKDIIN